MISFSFGLSFVTCIMEILWWLSFGLIHCTDSWSCGFCFVLSQSLKLCWHGEISEKCTNLELKNGASLRICFYLFIFILRALPRLKVKRKEWNKSLKNPAERIILESCSADHKASRWEQSLQRHCSKSPCWAIPTRGQGRSAWAPGAQAGFQGQPLFNRSVTCSTCFYKLWSYFFPGPFDITPWF